MLEQELKSFVQKIKDFWRNAPESKEVESQLLERFDDLKSKTSKFEKDLMKKDLSKINSEVKRVFKPTKSQ
jgi:hypothetical protein